MAAVKLSELIRLQESLSFRKELDLTPNIFEVFDLENNTVFVRYNDLQFISDFTAKLIERGWQEGKHFYITEEPHNYRLNLVNGNMMVEYNEFHDLYFLEHIMPPVDDSIVKYFRSFLNTSGIRTQVLIILGDYENIITPTELSASVNTPANIETILFIDLGYFTDFIEEILTIHQSSHILFNNSIPDNSLTIT
jgi:hypothetical protein